MRYFLLTGLVIGFSVLLSGCPKQCKVKTARCLGEVTQLCRPDGKWESVVDCSKIDPKAPWSCVCPDQQTCRCKKPSDPPRP